MKSMVFKYLAAWVCCVITSYTFFDFFLANGEYGMIEILTNIMYVVDIIVILRNKIFTKSTKALFSFVLFLLLVRELNLQRHIALLFVDYEYYKEHLRSVIYTVLYGAFLVVLFYAIKINTMRYYIHFLKTNIINCSICVLFVIISQISDSFFHSMIALAIEENAELMLPFIIYSSISLFVKNFSL